MARRVRPEAAQPTFASLLVAPVYYVLNLAWTTVMRAIPLLFPVAAVLLLVPALALLSLGAGWMVWSSVPTGWRAPLDFQYGDGIPYADTLLPTLVADQAYAISLHMVVSASEANFALGNFMTSIALYTVSNRTVASASKPSIFVPPRTWLRSPSTISHSIQLLTDVVPTASRLFAHVEVGRKDGWRSLGEGAGREVSIVQAWLVGEVKLSGLRAIIGAFPLSSTLAAMIIFFAFSLGGLLAFAGLAAYLSPRTSEPATARITQEPDFDEHPVVIKKEAVVLSPISLSEESDESSESSRGETVLVKSESEDEADTIQLRRRLSRDRVAADPDDS